MFSLDVAEVDISPLFTKPTCPFVGAPPWYWEVYIIKLLPVIFTFELVPTTQVESP